ncbi:iron chelate uptake ABC transporter family permease subunit [Actinokineospora auranticolor]|uniref:Iron complex transport system permease protein n=1 Tax=Actinokineospora auranticolor TaxID=155976 RepID=A0A2S6GLE0_9PSEU|nr:iron chelate uptake ABC transporter family permease subunit [Actinokineospora auranticolor]PPK66047.1 iron complex transport system permease protein [Actinokineospora auranticolor]
MAIAVGLALGAAGAIFQSVSANPLGSPDIIGFTTGSATGALLVLLFWRGGPIGVPLGSVLGGLAAAVLVYLLAYRNGIHGTRLIPVGIGVSAVLFAANGFLLSRASLREARNAQLWLVGSLNGRGWDEATPAWIALAVLLPLALLLGRRLAMLELGDETALSRGVPVERSRLYLVLAGVGLTALATAAAGPITFVALVAPQITHGLVRSGSANLATSGLTGALLLVTADQVGQHLVPRVQLPVGLTTGALGGAYLIWLLTNEWRAKR